MEEEKEFCKECSRKISKAEAKYNNGLCKFCYQLVKNTNNKNDTTNNTVYNDEKVIKENTIAIIIKFIAAIIGIIGIIYGLTLLDSYSKENMTFPVIIISIVSAIFIYSIGEIIQLLEDIKNK